MKYWKVLAEHNSTSTAWTESAGAVASPFSPAKRGRLIGLRTICGRDAASSLIDHYQWRLTCATFNPGTIEVVSAGSGLQTAPAFQAQPLDFEVDQPVDTGASITVEARCIGADTQVTPTILLLGLFTTDGN